MIALPDWTERGRELGSTLDACHAVVVVGSDPEATAAVALGIARVQAAQRRVAVADLLGGSPALEALVSSDDPHGIVDSFVFGVSLNRVAHQVPDSGDLFIIPSGTSPIDYEDIFGNTRWRRLAAGFREVGALLLVVAPVDAANLVDLVFATDGAVIVGDTVPGDIPVAQTVGWLRTGRSGATSVAGSAPLAMVEAARAKPPRRAYRMLASAAGLLLTVGVGGLALWFAYRPYASDRRPRIGATPSASPLASKLSPDSVTLTARADSVHRDSVTRGLASAPASDSFPLLAAANVSDSGSAAAWAVRLEQTNTKSGAILDLRQRFETVPAGTYGFDLRTRFYLLVAGAYATRSAAESLLVQLRNQRILAPGMGSVTALPFAFLVQSDVAVADVPTRLARFAARGQPVYALRQSTGGANLYFGAYESAQQAALAVPTVKEAGLTPALVYRIGRVF